MFSLMKYRTFSFYAKDNHFVAAAPTASGTDGLRELKSQKNN